MNECITNVTPPEISSSNILQALNMEESPFTDFDLHGIKFVLRSSIDISLVVQVGNDGEFPTLQDDNTSAGMNGKVLQFIKVAFGVYQIRSQDKATYLQMCEGNGVATEDKPLIKHWNLCSVSIPDTEGLSHFSVIKGSIRGEFSLQNTKTTVRLKLLVRLRNLVVFLKIFRMIFGQKSKFFQNCLF